MINLQPEESKEAIKYGKINLVLLQYIILSIIVVISILGVVVVGAQRLIKIENQINNDVVLNRRSINDYKTYHEQAKIISEQIKTLNSLFEREVKYSELLTNIGGIMPSGSALTQLTLNEDRTQPLNLTAVVVDESTAAVLRKNLEESELFSKADIISITSQEDENSPYKYQVSISVVFEGTSDKDTPKEGDYI